MFKSILFLFKDILTELIHAYTEILHKEIKYQVWKWYDDKDLKNYWIEELQWINFAV